jgi:thiamine-phosphate pyrophosphorylase
MSSSHSTLRILDANSNRVVEGLRVVEEYLRFVLGDRHLTEYCKQLRHDVSAAIGTIPRHELLASRDTLGDVGTQLSTDDEYVRATTQDIWIANQKRVEQSLRCLEEFAKPHFPATAAAFEQLRYRAYTLAKAADSTLRNRERLANSHLYVLVDGRSDPIEFARLVGDFIQVGVHILQLRDKRLGDRELVDRARQLRALTRNTPTLFIMNDRPDLAVLSDADGVHVGQNELRISDARSIVGPTRLIGVSTHSLEEARQAVLEGADYIGCGPTFPSETKCFADFPGLEYLRMVSTEIKLPAFAIGGITAENAVHVLETGVTRIAVSNAIVGSSNPTIEALRLLEQVKSREPEKG